MTGRIGDATGLAILACTFLPPRNRTLPILANRVAGFVKVNRTGDGITPRPLGKIEKWLFLLFLVLDGMSSNVAAVEAAGILTALIVIGRKAGKYLGARC